MCFFHGLEDPIPGDSPDQGRAVQNPGNGGHGNIRFPGYITDSGSAIKVHSERRIKSAAFFPAALKVAKIFGL